MLWTKEINDMSFWDFNKKPVSKNKIDVACGKGKQYSDKTWWSKRWLETIASWTDSSRLDRGISYARRQQVLSLTTSLGRIEASVQGSGKKPYKLLIKFKTGSLQEWDTIITRIAANLPLATQMLEDSLMPCIEQYFTGTSISLFPMLHQDMNVRCSCPDYYSICKHTVAVFYAMTEILDKDPLLLLSLRGCDKGVLIEQLRIKRVLEGGAHELLGKSIAVSTTLASFWQKQEINLEQYKAPIKPFSKDYETISLLGPSPLTTYKMNIAFILKLAYGQASKSASKKLRTHST